MNINWKIRLRNPIFWWQVAVSILAPVLAYFGLNWEDLSSWPALGNLFVQAVQNPVVVVAVLVSIWHAVTDPTTTGVTDSARALTYDYPNAEKQNK